MKAVLTSRRRGWSPTPSAPSRTWLVADAGRADGIMNVVRTTLGAGVDGPPPHFHKESPEMFYLLGGALRILAGDQVLTATKGDYLLVPPLMHHAWGTRTDTGADVEARDLPARCNPPSRGDWLGDCPRVVDLG